MTTAHYSILYSQLQRALLVLSISLCLTPSSQGESKSITVSNSTGLSANSAFKDPEFLAVDEAFKLSIDNSGDNTAIIWTIAADYYLYKHKIKLLIPPETEDGSKPNDLTAQATFSKGLRKTDDYYGQVEVYYHQAIAQIDKATLQNQPLKRIKVTYQGCAEAGLCYPVQTRIIEVP